MSSAFFKLYEEGNQMLISLAVTGNHKAASVFLYLCSQMDMNAGAVCVSKMAIAEKLNISQATLYRSIKILKDLNAISEPLKNFFAINPKMAWCGKSTEKALFYGAKKQKVRVTINPSANPEDSTDLTARVEQTEC